MMIVHTLQSCQHDIKELPQSRLSSLDKEKLVFALLLQFLIWAGMRQSGTCQHMSRRAALRLPITGCRPVEWWPYLLLKQTARWIHASRVCLESNASLLIEACAHVVSRPCYYPDMYARHDLIIEPACLWLEDVNSNFVHLCI